MIVGISGSFASGQDTVAKYLRDTHSFVWFSTSDMVRKVSMERHGSIERPDLSETATYMRKTRGGGVFAEEGLEMYAQGAPGGGLVLSGIRSLGEMNAVLKAGGIMVYIDADPDMRYERMVSRQRDDESKISKDAFLQREEDEWYVGESDADFNKRDIREHCDSKNAIIWNNGTLAALLAAVDTQLGL